MLKKNRKVTEKHAVVIPVLFWILNYEM